MVAQIQGSSMVPKPIQLRASFSNTLLHHFPRYYTSKFQKYCSGDVSGSNSAAFSSTATSPLFDEIPAEQDGGLSNKLVNLKENHRISANHQTYIWLLDGCLKSGSLSDAKKLYGRILKSGFDVDNVICSRLIDVYVNSGELRDAVQVFENMPDRNLSCWNKMICLFVGKKMTNQVLNLFNRMLAESVEPDPRTFANVLRACSGGKIDFGYVKQVHGKVIRHGLGTNTLVCNPLIDLYSKNGFIETAKRVFGSLSVRDNVSWVAMISGLSQSGHEEDGIHLFLKMHDSGTISTPYILSSVTSACTKIKLFELGEQLHALICKWGYLDEIFVCNALVTLYSRHRKFVSAEKIFSEMQHRDEVSYNSLISGLAQCGFSERSLQLFEKMQVDSLKPDCVTVAGLLSACASVGALHKGRQLHSYAIKAGILWDVIIEGSLLDLYVKCSDVETARDFFLTTQTENVVLWNVMLVAYGQLSDLSESVKIFLQMQIEGLIPNQYTYPSILRTCTSVSAFDLGEQIHTQVIKTGFQPNVYVCSVLIDMYAKHGKLDTALKILRQLNEEDVVSWTAMVAGYAQHDFFVEALKLFEEMLDQGIRSDNIGLSSAISACAGIQALSQGRQVHAQSIVSGYSNDLSISNALVSLYARCGRVQDAYLAFDNINVKDSISWNGLISGFAQIGHCEEALQVFFKMNRAGIAADMFTFGYSTMAGEGETVKNHSFPLDGRVAIVTGASRGIGRAVALHLRSLGAKLVINYASNSNQADLLASELNKTANSSNPIAIAVRANISEPAQVKMLFDRAEEEFGSQAHIMVNMAGVLDSKYPSIRDTTVEDWDMTFDVNTKGAFLCGREAANRLRRGGGGRIIMVSTSLIGASRPGYGAYTASKAAVEAMTKILAKELKGTGITANCVAPGPVATEMFFAGKTEETIKSLVDACPLGRLGEANDVAQVVGFLAADSGEWVNGQIIRVNGGFIV
ncbi:hypothetical protein RJ639_008200 [Escallonia herrerae]|uniref:Pentatricopeptide repeat-containing protein n=1 Tax=Escallonia herrerae TaxID=1293975 RepID=A0AA89ASA6_9ASTE|nr:hypothetical protein RJ639_008200 [Escallonia herrerae]